MIIIYLKARNNTFQRIQLLQRVEFRTPYIKEEIIQDDLHTLYQGTRTSRILGTVPTYPLWNNDYSGGYFWIQIKIDSSYSSASRHLIVHSVKDLEHRSQVIKFNFISSTNTYNNKPYIHIRNVPGCWSFLGLKESAYSRDGQTIGLDETRCMNSASIQHEILHALGFGHEQARLDRDQYIKIMWSNIKPEGYRQFYKVSEIDSLGTPYDLDSIMHYQPYDWSNGNGPSIIPRNGKKIGKRMYASTTDIFQMRLMYQCTDGPRHRDKYEVTPCSLKCQCWEGKLGCLGRDYFCKGNLTCQLNECTQPSRIIPLPEPSSKPSSKPTPPTLPSQPTTTSSTSILRQIIKTNDSGQRYFLVSGVVFDIQAKIKTIHVKNLIFKGLGIENDFDNVQIDIFTKVGSHLKSPLVSTSWRWIGSATLKGDGTDNAQFIPSNSLFTPIKVNPWMKQSFYIQVKNCMGGVLNNNHNKCNKLRVWEGNNYGMENSAYLEDQHVRMLEGCVLAGRFNNAWGNCRNVEGGRSFTFGGGFQYTVVL